MYGANIPKILSSIMWSSPSPIWHLSFPRQRRFFYQKTGITRFLICTTLEVNPVPAVVNADVTTEVKKNIISNQLTICYIEENLTRLYNSSLLVKNYYKDVSSFIKFRTIPYIFYNTIISVDLILRCMQNNDYLIYQLTTD